MYGYGLGLVVVIPAIITALSFGAGSFFLMLGVIYGLLFAVLYVKRISYSDEDSMELIKEEKRKVVLPKKILTGDEKENTKKIKKVSRTLSKTKYNIPKSKPILGSVKVKEHIFKEKTPNVIAQLREKTTKIENEKKQEEKKAALKKMKSFAKQIDKKKVIKNKDEIDEDELGSLGEGF